MVTISTPVRTRPRVSLAALIATRDASLATTTSTRARLASAARHGARGIGQVLSWGWRLVATLLTILASGISRHGLVLFGLGAFSWAAWSYSAPAGAVMLGLSALFLEARRR